MTTGQVRTVLGDVAPASLGDVNYHEHLFQVSPLLAGDELTDERRSGEEAAALAAAGTGTMVEATPFGMGRRPQAVARISAATGMHVVHVSGVHRSAHYAEGHPVLSASVAELSARFTREVLEGMSDDLGEAASPQLVRAGAIKAGIEYWRIDGFERRAIEAVGIAALATGAPVMVHLEHGSAAHEVLDLFSNAGLSAGRVALAHADRNLDPVLHGELAARGALLGYDGWARHRDAPDSAIVDCLERVVSTEAGMGSIVLGGDVARASRYRSYGGIPGVDYVARRVLPRLRERVGSDTYACITARNAARWLAFAPVG